MGIALFTISALFAPFQAFASRLAPARRQRVQTIGRQPVYAGNAARQPAARASRALPASSGAFRSPVQRAGVSGPARRTPALRVVHNIDSGIPVGSSGRMVISGRMADVCAELDRLAAIDSARQATSR
jgi:hypothetical protein